jgi:4a-hydroxytetrahydrobiopterin dehydratase
MGFMVKASYEAEELNHHPNWSNVYNRVKVELQTHSEGGVTGKDIELASRLDNI